jgi:transitional endoplasmic reticulum ATPase
MNLGNPGQLARVIAVEADLCWLDFRNGTSGSVSGNVSMYDVGDVVLVAADGLALVPKNAWPEPSWIGVVRCVTPEYTLVEHNSSIVEVPTSGTPCDPGNTVEVSKAVGVSRVLTERTISAFGRDDDHYEKPTPVQPDGTLGFENFGGSQRTLKRANELINVSLHQREQLIAVGARPIRGVLFTGPPGTGKTFLARIIASTSGASFFEISGPTVFSKWYGDSERRLRDLFDAAEREAKSIIFFDEIDSVAGKRDDNSHEASRRVVAQLLTLMDGFASDSKVVVIAATNRPQDLDEALRRPGRFDWEIEFHLPDSTERLDILTKIGNRMALSDGEIPWVRLVDQTDGWSPAEIQGIFSEAALLAVAEQREAIGREDLIGGLERAAINRNSRSFR